MPWSQHQQLSSGRWFTMTLAQQLGNVGSDFERALRWKEKKQPELSHNATTRTLELLDLILADQRWHNHRSKELTHLRKEVSDALSIEPTNPQSIKGLQKYFFVMARAARAERAS